MSTSSVADAGASAEAIRHHYDLGNDFYRIWLDPTLTYSCALWDDADDLERAQIAKLDHHIDAARAAGAERVLDIGCGWGSLLRRLVDDRGVGQAVGLTLSEAQCEWISGWDDPQVDVRLESWSEHSPDEPYDAIVSIGAMEHFVKFGLPRAERVAAYRTFFETCHELLRPGAWMSLQTIAKGNSPLDQRTLEDLMFIAGKIFPESDVPRLAEVAHAAEKLFEVVRVRNDREQYARTTREWLARLAARRDEVVAVAGEEMAQLYERYLDASRRQFESGAVTLLRLTLRRV